MARYRLKAEGYFENPFRIISVRATQTIGGEEVDVDVPRKGNQDVFSSLVPAGWIIEVADDLVPGDHMEPLDDQARKMVELHPEQANPEFHADLSCLPQTIDLREPEERMAAAFAALMSRSQPAPEPALPLSLGKGAKR
jgi:hypothetical protein